MSSSIKRFIAVFVLCLSLVGLSGGPAYAFNPLRDACATSGGGTSTACSATNTDPITGPNGVLHKASLVIATLAGVAAVIVIVISGFQFVTSSGEPQKAAAARSALIGAIVGLVIIVLAESMVLFVLNKL